MTADEYVPSEDDIRLLYVFACGEQAYPDTRAEVTKMERRAEEAWSAFLARVRRDAAREQFENFIANMQTMHDGTHLHAAQIVYAEVIRMAEVYAKANFPEETP